MFRALDSLVTVLKAGKGDAHTLRFVVHLSGDRYCPMHMAHLDDKGGNTVKMKWFKFTKADTVSSRRGGDMELLNQYVTSLEKEVQLHPEQWYNYYDFWNLR